MRFWFLSKKISCRTFISHYKPKAVQRVLSHCTAFILHLTHGPLNTLQRTNPAQLLQERTLAFEHTLMQIRTEDHEISWAIAQNQILSNSLTKNSSEITHLQGLCKSKDIVSLRSYSGNPRVLRKCGWVAETNSLLNCRTGNCTTSSNLVASASEREGRFLSAFFSFLSVFSLGFPSSKALTIVPYFSTIGIDL